MEKRIEKAKESETTTDNNFIDMNAKSDFYMNNADKKQDMIINQSKKCCKVSSETSDKPKRDRDEYLSKMWSGLGFCLILGMMTSVLIGGLLICKTREEKEGFLWGCFIALVIRALIYVVVIHFYDNDFSSFIVNLYTFFNIIKT